MAALEAQLGDWLPAAAAVLVALDLEHVSHHDRGAAAIIMVIMNVSQADYLCVNVNEIRAHRQLRRTDPELGRWLR